MTRTGRNALPVLAALALALAVLTLAGCSSFSDGFDDAVAGGDTAEGRYLDRVYSAAQENGSGIAGYGDERVVALGRAVCVDLDNGMPPGDIARQLAEGDTRGVPAVAGVLIGSAELHLCPGASGAYTDEELAELNDRGAGEG